VAGPSYYAGLGYTIYGVHDKLANGVKFKLVFNCSYRFFTTVY
jgi:hypothetical protein